MVRFLSLLFLLTSVARSQEMRGLWVHAFGNGFKTAAQVTQLIAEARAGNFNALFVQVRKRGDAYYNSNFEPKASDISSSFDPLADLIAKANTGGPRIEIHAWIVTYNIWNSETGTPSQSTHPYLTRSGWLTENYTGAKWDGANYALDQAHPEVQRYTFNVCQDIVSRYAVDGIHFDYVRYSDGGSSANYQPWGYHPVSVQRFQRLTGRTDRPPPSDAQWLQFRRDQVTALVRKVYLNTWKTRPAARVSAALICYGNAPSATTAAAFSTTEPYARVLQDWRGWMQEGILDLAIPMIYRDYSVATSRTQYDAWCAWARDQQFSRMSAAGSGSYLNSVANGIAQIKQSRVAGTGGQKLGGLVAYSYALTSKDGVPRTDFLNALTDQAAAEVYDPGGTPVFSTAVPAPVMSWKSDVSHGHIMGTLTDAAGSALDGATISISGPVNRTLKTDATGFYGGVDLPAGNYTLTISVPGYLPVSRTVTVNGAMVTEENISLSALNPEPFEITSSSWNTALRRMTLTWNSQPGKTYRVEISSSLTSWSPLATGIAPTGVITTWTSATLPSATRRFFRIAAG